MSCGDHAAVIMAAFALQAVISNTAPSTSAASAVPMDAWANRRTLQHLVDLVYQEARDFRDVERMARLATSHLI